MSNPAFPSQQDYIGPLGVWNETFQTGISQRRLLAGMILSGWLSGNYANQNSEPWTVEGAVYESLKYADELIKQTEET